MLDLLTIHKLTERIVVEWQQLIRRQTTKWGDYMSYDCHAHLMFRMEN